MYVLDDILYIGNSIDDAVLKKAELQVNNTDILCIMYTSGTTGKPKGAMLTHRNIVNSGYLANDLGVFNENSIILNPMPLFHVWSLVNGFVEPLICGCKVVILDFDPLMCLQAIQKEECTCVYGVPTMFIAMLNQPLFNTFSMKSVQHGGLGGTLCTPELLQNVMEKMNMEDLVIGYGLTETSLLVTDGWINKPIPGRFDIVGSPLPYVEVSIRDSNNKECPANEKGEIYVKGYNVMQGYYKMEEATNEALDKDGWFHTGDMGHFLPDGFLVIDGRIKDLIIRGGENIYPKEVENLLVTIPGIKDAQVTGIPSKKYGEEVGAFIILKQGTSISEEDIIAFCKGKISLYKVPKYVFFMDSFPVTASGKVQKSKLSELSLKKIQEKGISA
jgi:fatty-acyl-CoA synthase